MLKLLQPRLAQLGYIKIGRRGGGGKKAPERFTHFVITTLEKNADKQLLPNEDIMKALKAEPRELTIYLPFNSLEGNLQCQLAYYRGDVKYCCGDGEQAQRLDVVGQGEARQFGKPQPYGPCGWECPDLKARRCKVETTLWAILEQQEEIGGAYKLRTHSWNSTQNLIGSLKKITDWLRELGGENMLSLIPLKLRVGPQTVQSPEGGTQTVQVLQLVFAGGQQKLIETLRTLLQLRSSLFQEIRALAGRDSPMLPPAPDDVEEDLETGIGAEFYPTNPSDPPLDEMPVSDSEHGEGTDDHESLEETLCQAIATLLQELAPTKSEADRAKR